MGNIQLEGQKLMYHVKEVSKWLDGVRVAPIYVEIGPINSCNHKCAFCALDYLKSHGKSIDKDVLIRSLEDMAKFGVKSIMFAGEGEPLVYGPLPEVIAKAKEFGLDIAITSNGVFFDKAMASSIMPHLSWIKFSIDAGTKETYKKMHGCSDKDFDKVLENIRYASELKKQHNYSCTLGTQLLLMPENINEVETLIIRLKECGADYLALKPYSQHPDSINKIAFNIKDHDEKLTELSRKYSDDKFKVIYRNVTAGEIDKKQFTYDVCYGTDFFALVDALGNIIPCNLFYEKEDFYYGNLNKNTFTEIWTGEKRQGVVKKLYSKGCADCRAGCRMHYVNRYLHTLKNHDIEHLNFI